MEWKEKRKLSCALGALVMGVVMAGQASATTEVTVTIENLAPTNGTNFTPVWIGFHDGTFDTFDSGASASAALESLAEDGATAGISADFGASGAGNVDATIASPSGPPPFQPGQAQSQSFNLDENDAKNRYFSFLSMILPSNDAFIGNNDAKAFEVFDTNGNFVGGTFVILGSSVYDAGTEVNDELPANTAFFGQAAPNTGVTENGTVGFHPGFNATGTGGILDDAGFSAADFTQSGYEVARITITPEPASVALLGLGGAVLLRRRRA